MEMSFAKRSGISMNDMQIHNIKLLTINPDKPTVRNMANRWADLSLTLKL